MQVLHGLAGILPAVRDHAVRIDSLRSRDFRDHLKNVGNIAAVFRRHFIHAGHMHLGHDQNVHRRLQYSFGEPYGLSIDSTPGQGTTVIIRLPGDPNKKGELS